MKLATLIEMLREINNTYPNSDVFISEWIDIVFNENESGGFTSEQFEKFRKLGWLVDSSAMSGENGVGCFNGSN